MTASKNTIPIRIVLSIFLLIFAELSPAHANCNLSRPPRTAVADASHGSYVFIYPRTIAPNYSGCQTMWDERGNKRIVISFSQGYVVGYIGRDYSDDKLISEQNCNYKNGVSLDSQADCPSATSLKNGILTVPEVSENLIVPVEKDPRILKPHKNQ